MTIDSETNSPPGDSSPAATISGGGGGGGRRAELMLAAVLFVLLAGGGWWWLSSATNDAPQQAERTRRGPRELPGLRRSIANRESPRADEARERMAEDAEELEATPDPAPEDAEPTIPLALTVRLVNAELAPIVASSNYVVGFVGRSGEYLGHAEVTTGAPTTLELPASTEALAFQPRKMSADGERMAAVLPAFWGTPTSLATVAEYPVYHGGLVDVARIRNPLLATALASGGPDWLPSIRPLRSSNFPILVKYHELHPDAATDVRAIELPDLQQVVFTELDGYEKMIEAAARPEAPRIDAMWPSAMEVRVLAIERARLSVSLSQADGTALTAPLMLEQVRVDLATGRPPRGAEQEIAWLAHVKASQDAAIGDEFSWPRVENGRLLLEDLPPQAWRVRAVLPGGMATEWHDILTPPGETSLLELTLPEVAAKLKVRVRERDFESDETRPVRDAVVELYSESREEGRAWFTPEGLPRWGKVVDEDNGRSSFIGLGGDALGGPKGSGNKGAINTGRTNADGEVVFDNLPVGDYFAYTRPAGKTPGYAHVSLKDPTQPVPQISSVSAIGEEDTLPAWGGADGPEALIVVASELPTITVRVEEQGLGRPLEGKVVASPRWARRAGWLPNDGENMTVEAKLDEGVAVLELPMLGLWVVALETEEAVQIEPAYHRVQIGLPKPKRDIVFKASAESGVEVQILRPNGEPVEELALGAFAEGEFRGRIQQPVFTDAEGRARLEHPPGTYELIAMRGSRPHPSQFPQLLGQVIVGDPDQPEQVFVLRESSLTVTVRDAETGDVPEDVTVTLMTPGAVEDPAADRDVVERNRPQTLVQRRTYGNETVRYEHLPPGHYVVEAQADGYITERENIELPEGASELTLELEPGGATVVIYATNVAGEPLFFLRIESVREESLGEIAFRADSVMPPDEPRRRGMKLSGLVPGRYQASGSTDGPAMHRPILSTPWFDVAAGDELELTIQALPTGAAGFFGRSLRAVALFDQLEADRAAGLSDAEYMARSHAIYASGTPGLGTVRCDMQLIEPDPAMPDAHIETRFVRERSLSDISVGFGAEAVPAGRYRVVLSSDEVVMVPDEFEFTLSDGDQLRFEFEYDFIVVPSTND